MRVGVRAAPVPVFGGMRHFPWVLGGISFVICHLHQHRLFSVCSCLSVSFVLSLGVRFSFSFVFVRLAFSSCLGGHPRGARIFLIRWRRCVFSCLWVFSSRGTLGEGQSFVSLLIFLPLADFHGGSNFCGQGFVLLSFNLSSFTLLILIGHRACPSLLPLCFLLFPPPVYKSDTG